MVMETILTTSSKATSPTTIPQRGQDPTGLNLRSAMQDAPRMVTDTRNGVEVYLPTPKIVIPYELLQAVSDLNFAYEIDHRRLMGRQLAGYVTPMVSLVERSNAKIEEICISQSELLSQENACRRIINGTASGIEQLVSEALDVMNEKLDTMYVIPKSRAIDPKLEVLLKLLADCGLLMVPERETPNRLLHTLPESVLGVIREDLNKDGRVIVDYHTEKQRDQQLAQEKTIQIMERFISLPAIIKQTLVEAIPLSNIQQQEDISNG